MQSKLAIFTVFADRLSLLIVRTCLLEYLQLVTAIASMSLWS